MNAPTVKQPPLRIHVEEDCGDEDEVLAANPFHAAEESEGEFLVEDSEESQPLGGNRQVLHIDLGDAEPTVEEIQLAFIDNRNPTLEDAEAISAAFQAGNYQVVGENHARGESPAIQHIDELAFFENEEDAGDEEADVANGGVGDLSGFGLQAFRQQNVSVTSPTRHYLQRREGNKIYFHPIVSVTQTTEITDDELGSVEINTFVMYVNKFGSVSTYSPTNEGGSETPDFIYCTEYPASLVIPGFGGKHLYENGIFIRHAD